MNSLRVYISTRDQCNLRISVEGTSKINAKFPADAASFEGEKDKEKQRLSLAAGAEGRGASEVDYRRMILDFRAELPDPDPYRDFTVQLFDVTLRVAWLEKHVLSSNYT